MRALISISLDSYKKLIEMFFTSCDHCDTNDASG